MMVYQCRECGGTGTVEFTKEKGGPTCNNCGGLGFLSQDTALRCIASILDHPSVYMGGPSQGNLKKSAKIIEYLKSQGVEFPTALILSSSSSSLCEDDEER